MIFRLAFRNLVRRPMQSFLAAGAVGGSLMILITITNFQEGAWVNVVRDTVRAAACSACPSTCPPNTTRPAGGIHKFCCGAL